MNKLFKIFYGLFLTVSFISLGKVLHIFYLWSNEYQELIIIIFWPLILFCFIIIFGLLLSKRWAIEMALLFLFLLALLFTLRSILPIFINKEYLMSLEDSDHLFVHSTFFATLISLIIMIKKFILYLFGIKDESRVFIKGRNENNK